MEEGGLVALRTTDVPVPVRSYHKPEVFPDLSVRDRGFALSFKGRFLHAWAADW